MIAIERLVEVLTEVADTLVDDFDLIEFLHVVARHATEVSGATAVGVMLTDLDGQLHHLGASSEDVRLLELFQVQNSEGPCLDCYNSGDVVSHTALEQAHDRWPAFAPRAVAFGFRSVHAFPMRLRDQVIGALNVFGSDHRELGPDEQRLVGALADVATIALIQEQAISRAEILSEQLQGALNNRVVIEQAKGAIAQRLGISVEEAFELLRRRARAQRIRLTDLAYAVVSTPNGASLSGPPDDA